MSARGHIGLFIAAGLALAAAIATRIETIGTRFERAPRVAGVVGVVLSLAALIYHWATGTALEPTKQ